MDRLKGKVAIITGGNSGVGEATAKMFAKEGATVVITARREAALEKVAEEIKAAGGEVFAVSTDISKKGDPERLMDLVIEKYRSEERRVGKECRRKSTRLNSSHSYISRMPSSA